MFFGLLPRMPWHESMRTPNLLSCLTGVQRTAGGQARMAAPVYLLCGQDANNGLRKESQKVGGKKGKIETVPPPSLLSVRRY